MTHHAQFYIDGRWVELAGAGRIDVVDPATEQPYTQIAAGGKADVDRAVTAAKRAFETFALTTRDERLALLRRILDAYNARAEDLTDAVSREMGAPLAFARDAQVWAGRVHLEATIEALEAYESAASRGRA
jgi:aldehyde dehydrogenase (NAD+)